MPDLTPPDRSSSGGNARPWDAAWKNVLTGFGEVVLRDVCRLPVDAMQIVMPLPTELPRPVHADCVFKIAGRDDAPDAPPRQVIHIEVQVRPEPQFEMRLASYYTWLSLTHGVEPHQVVILPQGGPYTGRATFRRLRLEYDVVDVRTLDPGAVLAGPLAPLALWSTTGAAGSSGPLDPADLVEQVVDQIAKVDDPGHQQVLVQLAILKPEVAPLIVNALGRRNMSNLIEDTEVGRALIAQGRTEGRAEGRAEALLVLLEDSFPGADGLDDLALHLARTGDFLAAADRIRSATTVDDLRT